MSYRVVKEFDGRPPRRSKYGAIKTEVFGILFDSRKEAERYLELRAMQENGEIYGLELQWKMPIYINDQKVFTYVADFRYYRNSDHVLVLEDAKGFKTPVYRLKKKCVEAYYKIKITEV